MLTVFARSPAFLLCPLLLLLLSPAATGQDALKAMPGYAEYHRLKQERTNAMKSGSVTVTWREEGRALEYSRDGKRYLFDVTARKLSLAPTNAPAVARSNNVAAPGEAFKRPTRPARGRQYTEAVSPDGKQKAFYRDHNLWLATLGSDEEIQITTEGNRANRLKFGNGTWVYGEELDQNTAIWWSSNSQKVAFYRFDETGIPDYYLTLGHTDLHTRLDVEPYPKAGQTNPVPDLVIYDIVSRTTVQVDVRDGKPFSNDVPGHYVYNVSWRPDSRELLFHRTNRRQNILELCAADPRTGRCRVILREEWPASWVENNPPKQFLKDGNRFIWTSERNGWKNLYLYDLTGKLLRPLTTHTFEVGSVLRVDEKAGFVYYTARSGDNPLKLQLHRVGLDGKGDRRLTRPDYHHSVNIAPDGRHFVDIAQTHSEAPFTTLRDSDGREIAELARSDLTGMQKLKMRPVELFEFTAADGNTRLFGLLHYPANFTPRKRYPLIVDVYAGPGSGGARETFGLPSILTEFGFLYASLDSRSASGRGKRFLDSVYQNLGVVEIDDQAAGVRHLSRRPYVDSRRVGIFGTSYGGTAAALCLMRYPELFHAACASSMVSDFRNYDTIYTERYLWLPQEATAAYDRVRVSTYLSNLQGRLMLFYGTADDNVHPANTLQLVQALQTAGKSFDLQVGPDQGHTSLNQERMMEFFIRNLVLEPPARPVKSKAPKD